MEPNKRQFKKKQRKGNSNLDIRRTDSGKWEAVKLWSGEVAEANSPKAAKRQAVKQPTSATNNRKFEKVKLNKKETKAALEMGRSDYNFGPARFEEGQVSKSEWAGMLADDRSLKSKAIETAKKDKVERSSRKKI